MGNKYFIIILSLYLSGCSGFLPLPYVDARLLDYVIEFQDIYKVNNTADIVIDELPYDIDGNCRIWTEKGQTRKKVTINIDFYKRLGHNYYAMHQLMFHELGHCVLRIHHDNRLFYGKYPISIMYDHSFGMSSIYKDNFEYYKNGLLYEHRR